MTTEPTATAPIPAGYTSITPYLVVADGNAAIAFYTSVFGATLVGRTDGPEGTVAHAELDFGNGRLQLSDPVPSMGLLPPDGTNAVNHSYVLYCTDVDAIWRAAVDAGATAFEEPSTFVTGDRFGAVLDPFGHRWAIMTRVEDVDPAEAQRRIDEWMATQL
ncbi:VOC family protein [Arthrobacter sp. 35W]|uniref:VOC family protein n=1 Tax=Arthrobacter sp. 35W TaxID=1132441 RepID=UPI0003FA0974|nr:VOC family protein [Arthrobacter sp. 35W]